MQANLDRARPLYGGVGKKGCCKIASHRRRMALSYRHDRKYSAHPECRSERARGCVNNARLSTFIREIRVENFVNETRTNKRFALSKVPAIRRENSVCKLSRGMFL